MTQGIFILWERRTDRDKLMAADAFSTKCMLNRTGAPRSSNKNAANNVTAYKQSLVFSLYDYNV